MALGMKQQAARLAGLDADDAFIAMDASGHVSAEEAARAPHIICARNCEMCAGLTGRNSESVEISLSATPVVR